MGLPEGSFSEPVITEAALFFLVDGPPCLQQIQVAEGFRHGQGKLFQVFRGKKFFAEIEAGHRSPVGQDVPQGEGSLLLVQPLLDQGMGVRDRCPAWPARTRDNSIPRQSLRDFRYWRRGLAGFLSPGSGGSIRALEETWAIR